MRGKAGILPAVEYMNGGAHMRRFSLLTVLVLVFCFVLGQAASAQFDDAPRMDSWVYQSFKTVYDAGLIKGYPDGTFRGNRPATRNEVVEFMARLMAYFESRLGGGQAGTRQSLSEEDVKALIAEALSERGGTAGEEQVDQVYEAIQDLEELFWEELDQLDVRVTTLEKKVEELEKSVAKLEDDLAAVRSQATTGSALGEEELKKAKTRGTIGMILGAIGILLALL